MVIEFFELIKEIVVPVFAEFASLMGLFIIVYTLFKAMHHYFMVTFYNRPYNFLLELGSGLSAALEFLMVGEVLETIIAHSMESIVHIAALFGLRAMMSLLLHFEASDHGHSHKHSHNKAARAAEQSEEEEDDEAPAEASV